jgi:diguanylate cyclase (GGDEF)-like protein
MTLYRQLTLGIIILFVAGFTGTTLVSTGNLRTFLETQLETHAQDTATSLGLSLSPHMRQQDLPIMNLMIDAIFDRGYFQSIQLVDIEGNTLIERFRDIHTDVVPDWFTRLVSFSTPRMEAIVMSGWKQAGIVSVTSHPGSAYRELWTNTRDTFVLFLTVGIIILLAALVTLNHLLRPLREVEQQAEAISRQSWLLQNKLPKTRELRSVVVAMNKLTSRVKEIFSEQAEVTEELRRQVYLDALTGLPNRESFNRHFQLLLIPGENTTTGALLLVGLDALRAINDSGGYSAGDEFLRGIARIIKSRQPVSNPGFIARLSGSEFGVVLHGCDSQDAEYLASELCQDFIGLQDELAPGAADFVHIGLTMWKTGRELAEILAESDHALRTARSGAAVDWHRFDAAADREFIACGKEYLRSRILSAVAEDNITLFSQAVHSDRENDKPLHREVLLRLPDGHGNYTSTGIYQPVIDATGLASQLDRLAIKKLLAHIEQDRSQASYAINLSTASVTDRVFRDWLIEILGDHPRSAGRVHLEMMENTVANHIEQARELIDRLANGGYRTGIDHFGKDFHPFGYLGTIKIGYIKIDGYYTRDICDSRDNQFFIKALRDAVHTFGIQIFAQSVETRQEYETLRSIRLDGYQGYLFDKPEPLFS